MPDISIALGIKNWLSSLRTSGANALSNFIYGDQVSVGGGSAAHVGVEHGDAPGTESGSVNICAVPVIQFRVPGEAPAPANPLDGVGSFHDQMQSYNTDVMNWGVSFSPDWWGPEALSVQELCDKISAASKDTVSHLYSFHGAKPGKHTTSICFGCEHGRKREDGGQKSKDKGITKDMGRVDASAAGRRFVHDKRPAPSHTNMRRGKFAGCEYRFVLTTNDINESSPRDAKGHWTLSSRANSGSCSVHTGHPKPAFAAGRIKGPIAAAVTSFWHATATIPVTIAGVLQQHGIQLSRSQVAHYFAKLRRESERTRQRQPGQKPSAGGVAEFLAYLHSIETVSYRLLIQNVKTNAMNMCDEHGNISITSFSTAEETAGADDIRRIVNIKGTVYFVHAVAWVDAADLAMFEHYPQVLIIDTMHKANISHNLLNVISIDGQLLNNALLRAYIPCGTSAVYRWVLGTALPSMVPPQILQRVETLMSDSESALTKVIDSLTAPGDIMPNAKTMRCCWHMFDKNLADTFGFFGKDTWQSRALKSLYRLQKCDTTDELKYCIAFVMQALAGDSEVGATNSVKRRQVVEFILARVSKCEKWVRSYFNATCTRGIKASQRVESDFSAMARQRINGRLSWATTARRLMEQQERRHRERMAWITGQLTGSVFRNVTNPDVSTLTQKQLHELDKVVLPHALDAFEEQLILACAPSVAIHYMGCQEEDNVEAYVFCCDYGDAGLNEEEDSDVAAAALRHFHVDSASDASSDSEGDASSQNDDAAADAAAEAEADVWLDGVQDASDAADLKRRFPFLWDDNAFKYDQPIAPGTAFVYKKIRHVMFKQSPNDKDQCKISCTCGYIAHHGISCRHVLAVFLAIMRSRRLTPDDPLWADFKLQHLFNMNIVSKQKYHAACFGSRHFLESTDDGIFMSIDIVREYCQAAVPTQDDQLPKPGLAQSKVVTGKDVVANMFRQGSANVDPSSPRCTLRPRAWNTKAVSIMYQTIMELSKTQDQKDLTCTTFQNLIAALERTAPDIASRQDDARKHSEYDRAKGLKRGTRGGCSPSPPPKKIAQSPPPVPSIVTFSEVQKQASGATVRMLTRASSTGTTIAAPAPTQSDGITQFREGLQHLLHPNGTERMHAVPLFQAAVAMGHLEAHARLALMLMEGTAQVPKDVASAFRIASQGASKNCWHCIGVQAMCYLQGAGVQKDIATGTRLARESAKQDSYVGLYAMGRIYDQCVGIAPNVHNSKTGADRAPTHTHSHMECIHHDSC